jgi:Fic family protein
MRQTGNYQSVGSIRFFVPLPLPPSHPPLEIKGELAIAYGEAMAHLGELNEMSYRVPEVTRFIKAYVIKEALLSSDIEGIHTTIVDVFTAPFEGSYLNKSTQLVVNYAAAMDLALDLVCKQDFPIVSRVILAAHQALLQKGGENADPGAYRRLAVRVGNLVPAPADKVPQLMSELEKFINSDTQFPPLVQAGLAHVQFETIHPFLDGNGRIGRLLIVLMLVQSGLLKSPILYPSYYFKKRLREYYERLDAVRTDGDFEGWLLYYFKGIAACSIDACARARNIEKLERDLRATHFLQRSALTILFRFPVIDVPTLAQELNKSYNTAKSLIGEFVAQGILEEITQQKRNKRYQFVAYLQLLEADATETLHFGHSAG